MVAKRTYRIAGNRLVATSDSASLEEEPQYVASTNIGAQDRLVADSDLFSPLKPSTDVLVRGAAYSVRGAVRMLDTHVEVGPLRKSVRAWGRRTILVADGGRLRLSEPEAFESMPLTWDHAYGGRDEGSEAGRKLVAKPPRDEPPHGQVLYPRNPAGRGFRLDIARERLHGTDAPNLEDPADPITADRLLARDALDWLDRPAAVCYEPVDWWSVPRLAFWLGVEAAPNARPIYERSLGIRKHDELSSRPLVAAADPRAFNCATPGLCGVRLTGAEPVRLWCLHPTRELLEVALPAERPRLLLEPPGCGVYELPPVLATVLIEPSAERVTLTWTGTMEVAAPYPRGACDAMRSAVRWGT